MDQFGNMPICNVSDSLTLGRKLHLNDCDETQKKWKNVTCINTKIETATFVTFAVDTERYIPRSYVYHVSIIQKYVDMCHLKCDSIKKVGFVMNSIQIYFYICRIAKN